MILIINKLIKLILKEKSKKDQFEQKILPDTGYMGFDHMINPC